jgi:hypothetical protein
LKDGSEAGTGIGLSNEEHKDIFLTLLSLTRTVMFGERGIGAM